MSKYWLVGKVSVPADKKDDFNSAVLEVLYRCGIRKRKELTIAGKRVTVLEKPTADKNGIVEFDYSIFEKQSRDISTYDMNNCTLNTTDRGGNEYGLGLNLILLLQECYSNGTCYFMRDRELVPLSAYLDILCTLLQRKIEIKSRTRMWDILQFMRKQPDCDMPTFRDLLFEMPMDYENYNRPQLFAAMVTEDKDIGEPVNGFITERSQIKDAKIGAKLYYLYQIMIIEYAQGEKALFQYLKKLSVLPITEREKLAAADDNYGIIAELSQYLLPACMVGVFAILSNDNFWETWDSFGIKGYTDVIEDSHGRSHEDDSWEKAEESDFYLNILRKNEDEFLEFWDGENLHLSDSMKKEIRKWRSLWEETRDEPSLAVESLLGELLTLMNTGWYCRYVDADFVDAILKHKESPEWRRILLVLKKIMYEGTELFPELDRQAAVHWIKTYRSSFDSTAVAAFCSLIGNRKYRIKIFGF